MKTPDTRAAKRKGNVKARRMWHLHYADADTLHHTEREAQKIADKCEHFDGYPPGKKPVFVLPADAESYERMVEQVGPQIQRWLNGYALPAKYPTVAHAALAAIGIAAPRREGRGA